MRVKLQNYGELEMIYYAIADLHGRLDLLQKAFTAIAKDNSEVGRNAYTIITLGDYIDRGPQSKEIINYLMESQADYLSLVCLQGNHESMMVETIRTPLSPDWWLGNGGDTTMRSYGCPVKTSPCIGFAPIGYDPHVIPQDHVEWIAKLPLYYETEKQVFVHAGVPNDGPLEKQKAERLQWMLYSKTDVGGWKDKHVVHGHHQFADGPHEWSGRTDLDTYAWRTGRLVVGVFDDTQGKAVRYLEVLGDDYAAKQ